MFRMSQGLCRYKFSRPTSAHAFGATPVQMPSTWLRKRVLSTHDAHKTYAASTSRGRSSHDAVIRAYIPTHAAHAAHDCDEECTMPASVGACECPFHGAHAIFSAVSHDACAGQIRRIPTPSHGHRFLYTLVHARSASHKRPSSYANDATNILTEHGMPEHDHFTS